MNIIKRVDDKKLERHAAQPAANSRSNIPIYACDMCMYVRTDREPEIKMFNIKFKRLRNDDDDALQEKEKKRKNGKWTASLTSNKQYFDVFDNFPFSVRRTIERVADHLLPYFLLAFILTLAHIFRSFT